MLSPTATLVRPWPCRPGAGGWFGAPALAPMRWATRRGQPRDVAHELAVGDALAGDARVVERLLDQRRDARLVDDVRGQEVLHVPGDPRDGVPGRLAAAEGRREVGGDLAQALGAEVEREQELVVRGLHVVGDVEVARAAGVLVGREPQLVDLDLQVLALLGAVAEQAEERLADVAVGARDDRRDVAVVVLERVLLLARDAALDAEDDDDDQEQRDAQADGLADADGLAVGPSHRLARWTLSAAVSSSSRTARTWLTRDACGLVTLVEERHSWLLAVRHWSV